MTHTQRKNHGIIYAQIYKQRPLPEGGNFLTGMQYLYFFKPPTLWKSEPSPIETQKVREKLTLNRKDKVGISLDSILKVE